ncbi:hypothetical protein AB2B41_07585 [Marimonas sp. MJW-29]|uniref:Uncharacterized protein n=1 Tax=Sulfitobacter sediminis TaxID=3234186 RepID=A0ABV3RKH0_9RHOB
MPTIFKFYIKHCLIGFAISAVFIAMLLYFNVANLWHLISGSDIGLMALVVFWVLNGIVFAGVQNGVAIMLMAEEGKDDGGPRGGAPEALVPVPQTAPAAKRSL